MIKDISKYFVYLSLFCILFSACSTGWLNKIEDTPSSIPQNKTNAISPTIKPTSTLQMTNTPTPTTIFGYRIPEVSGESEMDDLQLKAVVYSNSTKDSYLRFSFSEDGNSFILYSEGHISVWQIDPIEILIEISIDDISHINNFNISNDRKYLAVNYSISNQFEYQLIVWNLETMDVIRNITLESTLLRTNQSYTFDYHEQGEALEFIPNTQKLIYANGKTIQIDNLDNNNDLITIDLGENMFAEKITFPSDGRFIYVYMFWRQNHTIPVFYENYYKVQIWDTNNHFLWREFEFPEMEYYNTVDIQYSYLLIKYPEKLSLECMNLENEEVSKLPYRLGRYLITNDGKYITFDHSSDFSDNISLEFYLTDSWKKAYEIDANQTRSFGNILVNLPDLSIREINKDHTILAASTGKKIYLFDVSKILTE